MTVLGEGGGGDGAERVADDDGWFADHLKEPVGVGDVVVEVVAAGGVVGASVAAQVEGVAVPPRGGALDDGHPARAVGGQAVQQHEGRAVVVTGFVVGDGGSAAGEDTLADAGHDRTAVTQVEAMASMWWWLVPQQPPSTRRCG